ncbi:hypothetical protein [Nocardioides plantarum]|uniref:Helicase XPB/Ssl2 N-terminal domain-containing protein n=1 Tax=Nocardioides plantarum TaxID=29299 RepID=A0ABV5K4I6_9ACTN|nr:hypothetical protein [Nocardioides plantarum]
MPVRARPGLHHAPVPGGVHVSGAAGELSLRGSDVLALALDALVPTLLAGADEDALVGELGGEPARPLVRALVSQLLDHDLLLDLDALTVAAPSAAVRAEHAEAIAHLEAVDADPYATFARLQATTVRVRGDGAAADAVRRGLLRAGVGRVVASPGSGVDADLVLVLDDARQVLVRLTDDVALVEVRPVDAATSDLWRRVQAWAPRLDRGPLPRPGADLVAAGYAVVLAVDALRAADPEADTRAVVVSGREARAETVVPPPARPAGDLHRLERDAVPETAPDPATLRALVESTAAPWTGGHDARGGLDLPQLPTALRHGVAVAHEGPARVVAGADQEQVALALALQMRRDAGGEAGAAGTTRLRWLLDGALRALGERAAPGTGWTLATRDDHAAWAPSADEAADDVGALVQAATEATEAAAAAGAARASEPSYVAPLGTDALSRATDDQVVALADEVLALCDAEGLSVLGVRAVDDPVLPGPDDVALWSGPVRLDAGAR